MTAAGEMGRGRRAGRHRHPAGALQPFEVDLVHAVDEVGRASRPLLTTWTKRLELLLRASPTTSTRSALFRLDDRGLLAGLGGKADLIVDQDVGIAGADVFDQLLGIPLAQRRLGRHRDRPIAKLQAIDVFLVFDEVHADRAPRPWPLRARDGRAFPM